MEDSARATDYELTPVSHRRWQISLEWRTTVIRNTKFQMLAVLAAGALIGYFAAAGRVGAPQVEASGAAPASTSRQSRSTIQAAATSAKATCWRWPRRKASKPAARNPTSSSSWATTSAGSTSALITGASCPAGRRTSTSWPRRACCSPTITPRQVARPDERTSSPARFRSGPA